VTWEFVIPGDPPSVNATYKIVYVGARCPTCGRGPARLGKHAGVETWQTEVAWRVRSARPSGWLPSRRTVIEVDQFTSRWHDSDNSFKALSDAIAAGLGCDDKGFLLRAMVNEVDKANPRTVVRVWND
jgi:Holliday junction resolvase RusA-like endonuclease